MRHICALIPLLVSIASAQEAVSVEGVVVDPSEAFVSGAQIQLMSAQGTVLRSFQSSSSGRFRVTSLPQGSYALEVVAANFEKATATLTVPPVSPEPLTIHLQVAKTNAEITVTARRGGVEDVDTSLQFVTSRGRDQIVTRPFATIGNVLEGAPGVVVQQTTYGAASPLLHGLTGYQTLLLLDSVRFNTSIFRSGPNQYAALIDPSAAERVEVTLGPSAANYGSDSMGGTINVLTLEPRFSHSGSGRELHGEYNLLGATADLSGETSGRLNLGTSRFAITGGGSVNRHNDLRAGRGDDSHNLYRRYFGLDRDQLQNIYGNRFQNTGFLQYSADARAAMRLPSDQALTIRYLRSDMQNVRSYRDQWGGANRILAAFDPQNLNFAWGRYEKLRLGPLDSLTGTFSFNRQNDGFIQKNSLLTDIVTTDDSQVNAYGYAAQATTHIGRRHALMFGGELYDEHIFSTRFNFDPVARATLQDRALYPNNSRYGTGGLFVQNAIDIFRSRLRGTFGLRYTRAHYTTHARDNFDAAGRSLGVIDSSRSFDDTTFNAGLQWQATRQFAVTANVSRGFRAPNASDLGTVGARTLGFDVPGEQAIAVNALIGLDSGDGAGLSGKKVTALGPETLMNYEAGFRFQTSKIYIRSHFFDAELHNPISGRTLLFPVNAAPTSIGGVPVTPIAPSAIQRAQGVVAVATALTPRSVKTTINDGNTRYFGTDNYFRYRMAQRWTLEANYSFMGGLDLNPVRPTRRLPPQEGGIRLRYMPSGRRPWVEAGLRLAGPQLRLNGGDIDDDRMGSSRRRSDIATLFRSFPVSGLIRGGPDGRIGNADDVFFPTGETLLQIQNRVLPLNAVINGVPVANDGIRVPLYPKVPGWTALNLRAGYPISEHISASFGVNNLLDRNYRAIGSGVDAPGMNVFAGLRWVW